MRDRHGELSELQALFWDDAGRSKAELVRVLEHARIQDQGWQLAPAAS